MCMLLEVQGEIIVVERRYGVLSCFGVRYSILDRDSLFSAFQNSTAEGKCFDSFFSEVNFKSKFAFIYFELF